MIQRSRRKQRRRLPAVILIVAMVAIVIGLSTHSMWNIWADHAARGPVQTVNNDNKPGTIINADLDPDGTGTNGKVQTADGDTGQTEQQTKPPVPPAPPAVVLDKPTSAEVHYTVAPGSKLVALTFDDGPDHRYTPAILDILKTYKVKATFFTVGSQVKKYPDIMKRIVKDGHALGNHSYNHPDLSKMDSNSIKNQIKWTDILFQRTVGFVPCLVRAPYGAVSPLVKDIMSQNNRELIGWTVDTKDWAGDSVAKMRANVNKNTHPGGIILMHSFGGKSIHHTVQLVPLIIQDLKKKGYTFVTVEELLSAKEENHKAK
ncbi:hypothetical protein Back11_39820 [Paenibacillus baekrokdamisoli]|uniref:NodB homology domain-containing protein n=1 Tax=Paenibacillus baekrokdamisoli TaxID=1712516 RepID=A0A3G9IUZ4_9BACL|nr:polysaccharide deacetylase family protein [Paenibacillus baekrokdamisoli]MBB3068321.1 peptidoglycan/xylan/chitin deacetylase (PgdA/CDA1 family) [Paenibacillus baekrokdamisoli]BBH22637.1 hypothetical protein Back11_39820 [Paenibacillus baekrokdamisoli]